MYLPRYFGLATGYNLSYPGDEATFPIAEVAPIGGPIKDDRKASWMSQGKSIWDGHEVAHCKIAGGVGGYKPVPAATIFYAPAQAEYAVKSGLFQNSQKEAFRFLIADTFALYVNSRATTSSTRVDIRCYFDGTVTSKTGGRYFTVKARITINKSGSIGITNTNVPTALRAEFRDVCAGFMSSVLDVTFKRTDFDYNARMAESVMKFVADTRRRYAPKTTTSVSLIDPQWSDVKLPAFVLDEPSTLLHGDPITVPYGAYHLKALMQEAYVGCLDSVPTMSDNNISNALEIVGLIKGLVVDHKIEVPKHISDAWLSYRYVYKTTEMDVKQTLSYIRRASRDLSKGFSCYGQASGVLTGDVDAVVRCKMSFKHKEFTNLETLCEKLYTYGLTPNAYVIWDMIPYSFVIDWLIPIGNILQAVDRDQRYNRSYDITDIWYSLSYLHRVEDGTDVQCYTRWGAKETPGINGFYTIETMSASKKVVGMRILDALSLTYRR